MATEHVAIEWENAGPFYLNKLIIPPLNLSLSHTHNGEVLRFTPTGEIYVKGELATNHAQIVNALQEWAAATMGWPT